MKVERNMFREVFEEVDDEILQQLATWYFEVFVACVDEWRRRGYVAVGSPHGLRWGDSGAVNMGPGDLVIDLRKEF